MEEEEKSAAWPTNDDDGASICIFWENHDYDDDQAGRTLTVEAEAHYDCHQVESASSSSSEEDEDEDGAKGAGLGGSSVGTK